MNPLRAALLELDLARLRALWAQLSPHLPQLTTDADTLACAHHARTQARSIPLKARAYSHRWLLDHGLPSGLPDELKPRAERLYPRIVEGVGIFVVGGSALTRPIVGEVRAAMADAVAECYADGDTGADVVLPRMRAARDRTMRELLGLRR